MMIILNKNYARVRGTQSNRVKFRGKTEKANSKIGKGKHKQEMTGKRIP